jgi:hypothetical protein
MKDTPIFFTRSGSFTIQEFFNDLENINNNFLNTKQENKMKVELIEEVRYNETIYYVKVDGSYVAKKNTYEEAKEEFDKAFTFVPKTTVLEVKEVEL